MTSRDYLRSAITNFLAPAMTQRGFHRIRPKYFGRVRGDLIDRLGFQVSRWGSKDFYVHAWISPKCSPPSESYLVGTRYVGDNSGIIRWTADNEEHASLALNNVRDHYLNVIEPWFQSISNLEAFVQAYLKVRQRRRKSAEYLAMMLALGRLDEYRALIAEIDERGEEQSPELIELRTAETAGREFDLLNCWRLENENPFKK